MAGTLYLVPTLIGETDWRLVLPAAVPEAISNCRHFIVEDIRSARRFIRLLIADFPIDDSTFYLIDKHTKATDKRSYLDALGQGKPIAVLSEAGCPGIADPGSDIVRMAHEKGYPVVPLVGPSSILLSLMASGLNGQHFTFHGYLPIEKVARGNAIIELDRLAKQHNTSHIFIEAPYRNNHLVADILANGSQELRLCIAKNITAADEFIKTKPIKEWKKAVPDLHKEACIFILGY